MSEWSESDDGSAEERGEHGRRSQGRSEGCVCVFRDE